MTTSKERGAGDPPRPIAAAWGRRAANKEEAAEVNCPSRFPRAPSAGVNRAVANTTESFSLSYSSRCLFLSDNYTFDLFRSFLLLLSGCRSAVPFAASAANSAVGSESAGRVEEEKKMTMMGERL